MVLDVDKSLIEMADHCFTVLVTVPSLDSTTSMEIC